MLSKRVVLPLLATGCVAVSAGPIHHRAHPPSRGGIPAYEYQYFEFSPTSRSLSEIGLALPASDAILPTRVSPGAVEVANAVATRSRWYQFVVTPMLQVDHCILSDLAVLLNEQGEWLVSFRAYQNPRAEVLARVPDWTTLSPRGLISDEVVTTLEPRRLQSSHILRNQFYVQIRMLAGNRVGQDGTLGFPTAAVIDLEPFWVQRDQPLPYQCRGNDRNVRNHFDQIERVEIEFKYRRK